MSEISVVIPTCNRAQQLKCVLESLASQEGVERDNYEIIVVDNNSNDNTSKVVESFKDVFQGKLRYCFEERQGICFARNRGVSEAKGDIISFTDDDVFLDNKWLSRIQTIFSCNGFDAIGGRILPIYPDGTPTWIKKNKNLLSGPIVCHDYGKGTFLYDIEKMVPFVGANMTVRKKCFEKVQFNTKLGAGTGSVGEDTDFFKKLCEEGFSVYYCGEVLLWHPVLRQRMTYIYLAKWYISSGRFLVRSQKNVRSAYVLGIPRYIYRQLPTDILLFLFYSFDDHKRLRHWRNIFRNIGRCIEYRSCGCA